MAFENINISSLKSNINTCINTINYARTKNIINNISNNNVWQAESKNNLKKSLETLHDSRYKDLKNYLNKCLIAAEYIERYKEEEAKIRSYQSQISYLNQQLASIQANCQTYIVCRGDTLWGISLNYGISMNIIADVNGFSSINDTIYVGQTILIPEPSSLSNISNLSNVSNQISDLKYRISQCKAEMSNLESKVYNAI